MHESRIANRGSSWGWQFRQSPPVGQSRSQPAAQLVAGWSRGSSHAFSHSSRAVRRLTALRQGNGSSVLAKIRRSAITAMLADPSTPARRRRIARLLTLARTGQHQRCHSCAHFAGIARRRPPRAGAQAGCGAGAHQRRTSVATLGPLPTPAPDAPVYHRLHCRILCCCLLPPSKAWFSPRSSRTRTVMARGNPGGGQKNQPPAQTMKNQHRWSTSPPRN